MRYLTNTCLLLVFATIGIPPGAIEAQQEWTRLKVHPRKLAELSYEPSLYPLGPKRHQGNAAVPFLGYFNERSGEYWKSILDARINQFHAVPLDEFNREEHYVAVDMYYLRRAAFCSHVDWQRDIYNNDNLGAVLLPDVQQSRSVIYALAVNLRSDIAEGNVDRALEKLEIGFGVCHFLQTTPFYVVKLVGKNNVDHLLDQINDLLQVEACPNLYWALNRLPDPFLEVQPIADFETFLFSFVHQMNDEKTVDDWKQLASMISGLEMGSPSYEKMIEIHGDQEKALEAFVESGKQGLLASNRFQASEIEQMSTFEIAARWYAINFARNNDRMIRWLNFPPHIALPNIKKTEQAKRRLLEESPELAVGLSTSNAHLHYSIWSVQRRIAALQIVELLRDYAAKNDSQLPQNLQEITAAPVPVDPFTNRPFIFERKADTAYLSSEKVELDEPDEVGVRLEIKIIQK